MGAYYKVPLLVWLAVSSCAREIERQRAVQNRVDALNQKVHDIVKSITINKPQPPFDSSGAGKQQFLDRLKTQRVGSSVSEVVKLLGSPYSVTVRSTKEGEPRGFDVEYCFRKRFVGADDRYDQYVEIYFGNDGKLKSISYQL